MAPSRGLMLNIGLHSEKHEKIFWSESIDNWYVASPSRPLPSCSNNAIGAKNGPAPGGTCFTLAYIVKT